MDPDPLQSYKWDPDSYQGDGDPDPACHSDADADPDPSFQNYANQCGSGSTAWKLFLGTVHKLLKTIYWKIYKITTLAGSGSALKSRIRIRIMWKVGSKSTSIKNLNPDPHQIKIRIRIRIKMIRSYRTMYTFYVSFSFTCLVFYLFWSVTEPDLDSAVQSVWLRIPDPEGAESLDLFQKCFFSCF